MPSDNAPQTTTLATDLRRLGLLRTADDLNDRIAEATRKRWSPTVLLEHLVASELEDRQRRSVERRLTRARLGRFKPLADWDWDWPAALDRSVLERILTLDFLTRGENVILVGPQGPRQNHARQEHRPPGHPRRSLRLSSPPPPTCSSTSTARRPPAPSNAGSATTPDLHSSSSTRSDTSPTTPAPPTSSSNSSAAVTSTAPCSSPPTCPSSTGTPSSPTPPAPSPSSTGSPTTSRSSSSRARASADARPNSRSSNAAVRPADALRPTAVPRVDETRRHRFRKVHFLAIANTRRL